jgi:CRISPR/Cas system-associated protein Cas5 (RAMP superfamily)
MEKKALPPDCIMLGNGEHWTVPLLPGGTSEDAVKTVDLYLKCKEEIKRLGVKNSIFEVQRTRVNVKKRSSVSVLRTASLKSSGRVLRKTTRSTRPRRKNAMPKSTGKTRSPMTNGSGFR